MLTVVGHALTQGPRAGASSRISAPTNGIRGSVNGKRGSQQMANVPRIGAGRCMGPVIDANVAQIFFAAAVGLAFLAAATHLRIAAARPAALPWIPLASSSAEQARLSGVRLAADGGPFLAGTAAFFTASTGADVSALGTAAGTTGTAAGGAAGAEAAGA